MQPRLTSLHVLSHHITSSQHTALFWICNLGQTWRDAAACMPCHAMQCSTAWAAIDVQ
jgi:hypothetical protein